MLQRAQSLLLAAAFTLALTFCCTLASALGVNQSSEPLVLGPPSVCPVRPAFFNASTVDECRNPIPHTCSFYSECAEAELSCGERGYPLAYGLHYCTLFQQQLDNFTPAGRAWVLRTMTCLQHALVPVVPELAANLPAEADCGHPWTVACDNLHSIAFASHPGCYVDSGICELKDWHDYALILHIVGFMNVLSVQAVQTGLACVRRWL
ncbi:hypothetical protein AURDEDRAFT_176355 [Auricularia subglabra TFB-10046 SS5]|uniref:Extracellular membrane protein CFEM domain-containing protein n=1 Tax=Auricularia subglabra (strain TFB-10046 / SS5) TaxID=717982 RepID=J0WQ69_AURST|nr:hypothetical protein AURDEDRAFT_176355 [Auricularia subglabra TFB-10046 SS5]